MSTYTMSITAFAMVVTASLDQEWLWRSGHGVVVWDAVWPPAVESRFHAS